MKQINHRGYLLVETEKHQASTIDRGKLCLLINWGGRDLSGDEHDNEEIEIDLPEGQWEIIGKGNEINGNQWEEILYPNIHEDYTKEKQYLFSAKNSGESLIKSHGMKPETTLILKLKTNE